MMFESAPHGAVGWMKGKRRRRKPGKGKGSWGYGAAKEDGRGGKGAGRMGREKQKGVAGKGKGKWEERWREERRPARVVTPPAVRRSTSRSKTSACWRVTPAAGGGRPSSPSRRSAVTPTTGRRSAAPVCARSPTSRAASPTSTAA